MACVKGIIIALDATPLIRLLTHEFIDLALSNITTSKMLRIVFVDFIGVDTRLVLLGYVFSVSSNSELCLVK